MIRPFHNWIFILLFCGWAQSVEAGIFKRQPKGDAAEHVPTLLETLSRDKDERRRADAAEDLRDYDPGSHPNILPVLFQALKSDKSTHVRLQVVSTLGKMKPTPQIASALEQARLQDQAFRVRNAALSILVRWSVFDGVRPNAAVKSPTIQTDEPPLADTLPQYPGKFSYPRSPGTPTTRTDNLPAPSTRTPDRYVPPKSTKFVPLLAEKMKAPTPSPIIDGPALTPPQ